MSGTNVCYEKLSILLRFWEKLCYTGSLHTNIASFGNQRERYEVLKHNVSWT
jgi:hypothetical protein